MTYQELADRIHAIEMTVEKAHEDLTALLVAVEKMEKAEKAAKTIVELDANAKAATRAANEGVKNPQMEAYAAAAAATKPLKLEDVRAVLTTLSSNKGAAAVKQLLKDFGADKLSDIAVQDYPELLAKAEEMGQ